ncbi:hypothetical protein LEMLEM_LOCUS6951, partial [Lemmus lemmus]
SISHAEDSAFSRISQSRVASFCAVFIRKSAVPVVGRLSVTKQAEGILKFTLINKQTRYFKEISGMANKRLKAVVSCWGHQNWECECP